MLADITALYVGFLPLVESFNKGVIFQTENWDHNYARWRSMFLILIYNFITLWGVVSAPLFNVSVSHCRLQYLRVYLWMSTSDSDIQWLQIRILHRILPVNYYIKKINVVNSDKCSFCKKDNETIQHVFF